MKADDRGADGECLSPRQAVFDDAVELGAERLASTFPTTSISAFIAGFYVSVGALVSVAVEAAIFSATGSDDLSWLFAAFFYPLGFIFVVLGRSELVTENFLHPSLAVWRRRATYRQLLSLWTLGLVFNLLGVAVSILSVKATGLVQENSVLGARMIQWLTIESELFLEHSWWTMVGRAVWAGLLINFMSWLLVTCKDNWSRIAVIWLTTFPIMLLETHHSVVGSAEVLLAMLHGAEVSFGQWLGWYLAPVAVGNTIGGVVFVAALYYLQYALRE